MDSNNLDKEEISDILQVLSTGETQFANDYTTKYSKKSRSIFDFSIAAGGKVIKTCDTSDCTDETTNTSDKTADKTALLDFFPISTSILAPIAPPRLNQPLNLPKITRSIKNSYGISPVHTADTVDVFNAPPLSLASEFDLNTLLYSDPDAINTYLATDISDAKPELDQKFPGIDGYAKLPLSSSKSVQSSSQTSVIDDLSSAISEIQRLQSQLESATRRINGMESHIKLQREGRLTWEESNQFQTPRDLWSPVNPSTTKPVGHVTSWTPLEAALKSSPFVPNSNTCTTTTAKQDFDTLRNTNIETFYPIRFYNESLNYRRLLEKNVICEWKLIVDRIIRDNDQQASIFLQQKLKVSNNEQKMTIIASIIANAYDLMINRFGNFLIQRCLEYGNEQQIESLAKGMLGNVINLAMDTFGCHVVQKALDCVCESTRREIVGEMLEEVKISVDHRYACHVWQKLFELRWDHDPPQIMDKVNRELKGEWTQVALGETGSLVVQNIFENCSDEDKLPCIEEVIENLDTIIKGQWGNWVIQHMVEHSAQPYKEMVVKKVIENAATYSIDQFASKAVEKLLKLGDLVIIQRFLDRVIQRRACRPRIPLVDIASNAHGNYLIQYILQSGSQAQKILVATQIKNHMVSLRGSKWGSKCAQLIDKNRQQVRS